ncbi:MAG TPA: cytochrome C oxidase subunit IV family protein [Anaeromyxobacteraceae bacterium]|nr:cytochrome C oxidase subunit IV family protein [Anaeromyxobacteraceae bacterium]
MTDPRGAPVAHAEPPPSSARALLGTAAALLALTAVTVAASRLDLGAANGAVALAIAAVKVALVAAVFMRLRGGPVLHAGVLLAALLFLALFVSVVVFDGRQVLPEVREAAAARAAGRAPGR